VRNKQSCIKVAVDFFSAENAAVCTDLLADFRALAKATTKKGGMRLVGKRDDVLQPYNCLLFNWISLTGVSFERAVKTHKVDLANGKLIDEPSDSGSELTDLDEIEHEDFMLDYDLKSSEQSVSIQEDSGVGAESHRGNRKRAGLSNLDGDAAPMTNSKRVKKEHVPSTTGQKKANQRGSTAELDSNCDDDDVDAPQPRAKRVKRVSVRAPHKRRKVKGQVVTEVSTLEALSPSGSELGVRTVGPGLHLTKL
jgi:lysine-specific demethylase 3